MKTRPLVLPGRRGVLLSLTLLMLWSLACAPASQDRTMPAAQQPAAPVEQPKAPVTPPSPPPAGIISQEETQKIALNFVRNEATFRFDGIEDTLKLVRSSGDQTAGRWEFEYAYQSRQAGYGDRKGLVLAQVITDHRARVVVEQGRVVNGVLDGKWDMLRQEMLR